MSKYAASLDFGSSKIALAVGEKTESGIRIVSYRDAQVVGINNGEIIKDRQAIEAITTLIREAEEDIQEKITEVTISLSGKVLHSKTSTCNCLRSNPEKYIDEKELAEITRARYNTNVAEGEAIFEAIPQSYDIDEYLGRSHEDLNGMKGKSIAATFCLIYGKESILSRRIEILDACNLRMKKAILAPVASARAVLSAQEMENGAALVDIGFGTTDIAIVKDNTVRAVATIPFAGEAITRDIKNVANITSSWAENVKTLHGCCCADFSPENKKLILRSPEENVDGEIELQTLSEIIEARMSEILEAVRYIIDHSGYADKLAGGVVITGGTAYMEFIQQLAKALLGQKVRLAAPRGAIASDSTTNAFDAYSSTAVGLVLESISPMLSHASCRTMKKVVSEPERNSVSPKLPFGFGGFFDDNGESRKQKKEEEEDRKERERIEKEREKQEKEREKQEKEREKQEKERERMEREKERQRKERERELKKELEKKEKEREKALRKEKEKEKREKKQKEPGLFDMIFGSTNDNA